MPSDKRIFLSCCFAILIMLLLFVILSFLRIEPAEAYSVHYINSSDITDLTSDIDFNGTNGMTYVVTPANIFVLDGKNSTIIDRIPITSGAAANVAYNSNNNNIYVTDLRCTLDNPQPPPPCVILTIDGKNNTVIQTVNMGRRPLDDIAVDPTDGDIYALRSPVWINETRNAPGMVFIVDGKSGAVIKNINIGLGLETSKIIFNPANGKAYVTNQRFGPINGSSGSVSIIDGKNNSQSGSVPVGVLPFTIKSNPVNGKTYVGNQESKTVSVIDGQNGTVIKNITIEGIPTDIAFDSNNRLTYVASGFTNSTYVLDSQNDTILKTIPLEGSPEALAYDPKNGSILVALQNGMVSVIDDKTSSVIDNIPLKLENALYIDRNPLSGNFYVRNDLEPIIGIIEPS